jgi:hypothetical protein
VHSDTVAISETEAFQVLLARAQRRTGRLPADRIVRHVLSVAAGGDWPVQQEALEAVLRRISSAHADGIRVVGRPRTGPLGLYATRPRIDD